MDWENIDDRVTKGTLIRTTRNYELKDRGTKTSGDKADIKLIKVRSGRKGYVTEVDEETVTIKWKKAFKVKVDGKPACQKLLKMNAWISHWIQQGLQFRRIPEK